MIISKQTVNRELAKRRKVGSARILSLDSKFPHQNAFIEDASRFIAAQCSRRAGKTNGLALKFFKTLEKYPKSQSVYLALTRDSARDIMWPILHEINDRHQLGCKFVDSRLTMTHPNGAKLILYGADMSNFIKRLKGRKYPAVAIDEAQDFGAHLQSLVDDVLTPSIADYIDGWLAITGTPGPVPNGYFFEVMQKRRFGYSLHAWTLLENPHMPDPYGFLMDLREKREWDENHPTYLREYRNQWVLDVQSLWVQYKESLNHFDELPKGLKYNYILGVDFGYKDADALAVLAWSESTSNIFLAEEKITKKQGLTELNAQIDDVCKRYAISKIVADEGGLGKKMAEEFRRRYHMPIQPADKTRKQENVELLNDYLRLGKFKASKTSQFAQDSYLVQIDWDRSTPDKIVVKKKPHSDIIDAVLYAFKESPAYTYRHEKAPALKSSQEWLKAQENALWEAATKHFQEEKEREDWVNNLGWPND